MTGSALNNPTCIIYVWTFIYHYILTKDRSIYILEIFVFSHNDVRMPSKYAVRKINEYNCNFLLLACETVGMIQFNLN